MLHILFYLRSTLLPVNDSWNVSSPHKVYLLLNKMLFCLCVECKHTLVPCQNIKGCVVLAISVVI